MVYRGRGDRRVRRLARRAHRPPRRATAPDGPTRCRGPSCRSPPPPRRRWSRCSFSTRKHSASRCTFHGAGGGERGHILDARLAARAPRRCERRHREPRAARAAPRRRRPARRVGRGGRRTRCVHGLGPQRRVVERRAAARRSAAAAAARLRSGAASRDACTASGVGSFAGADGRTEVLDEGCVLGGVDRRGRRRRRRGDRRRRRHGFCRNRRLMDFRPGDVSRERGSCGRSLRSSPSSIHGHARAARSATGARCAAAAPPRRRCGPQADAPPRALLTGRSRWRSRAAASAG